MLWTDYQRTPQQALYWEILMYNGGSGKQTGDAESRKTCQRRDSSEKKQEQQLLAVKNDIGASTCTRAEQKLRSTSFRVAAYLIKSITSVLQLTLCHRITISLGYLVRS